MAQMPGRLNQIASYSGFKPRYPVSAEPQSAKWAGLQLDRESMLRQLFRSLDFNSDGVLTLDEVKRLVNAALLDPEDPMLKDAFATADFSGNDGGGGDGGLTVDELIHSSLESTAALSDEQFDAWCAQWSAIAAEAMAPTA